MKTIFRAIGHNAWGEGLSRIPMMSAQLIIANVLGPSAFGIWSFIQIVVNYNNLSSFGLNSALAVEEPIAIGRSKQHYAAYLRGVVFTYVMVIAFVLATLILTTSLFCSWDAIRSFRKEFFLVGLILVAQQIFIYFQTTYQNNFNFFHLSICLTFFGFTYLFGILFSIYTYGLAGLLSSWLLSFVVAIVFFIYFKPDLRPKIIFDANLMKDLFKVGFPLYLAALLKIAFASIDKLCIGFFLGSEKLGFYNVVFVVVSSIIVFSGLISRVLAPNLLQHRGEGGTNESLCLQYLRLTKIMNWCLAFIVVFLIILFEFFLERFLPLYLPALHSSIVLILAAYFMGVVQFLFVLLTALRLSSQLLMSSLILFILLSFVYLSLSFFHVERLIFYAGVSLLGWLSYTLILVYSIHFKLNKNLIFSFLKSIFLPFFTAFLLVFINYFEKKYFSFGVFSLLVIAEGLFFWAPLIILFYKKQIKLY